jgi:tetratricopeptide (TPR) repeat protein
MGLNNMFNWAKINFQILFVIIILNLTLIHYSNANERQIQLNKLFQELKTDDFSLSHQTEQKIWKIWSTHPTDEKLTSLLEEGSFLVNNNQLLKAINIFTEAIEIDPYWAEAWNKRATVLYMIGDYQKSQDDINKVLELEVRHFGALAGQGLVNIQLKNYEKALKSYEKVQEIYPTMKSPKIMIKEIKDLIKNQSI